MTPRKYATKSALAKKVKYFNEGRITNHYPHKIKVFPKIPNLYKPGLEKAEQFFTIPTLTETEKRLAGF